MEPGLQPVDRATGGVLDRSSRPGAEGLAHEVPVERQLHDLLPGRTGLEPEVEVHAPGRAVDPNRPDHPVPPAVEAAHVVEGLALVEFVLAGAGAVALELPGRREEALAGSEDERVHPVFRFCGLLCPVRACRKRGTEYRSLLLGRIGFCVGGSKGPNLRFKDDALRGDRAHSMVPVVARLVRGGWRDRSLLVPRH